MGLRFTLAIPACVIEDLPARKAIRRSIELSKGARGRIFLLALLVVAVQMGLGLVTQLFFVIATFRHHGELPAGIRVVQQLVAFCTNTFVGPIYATGFTLFYYDQRVRKEGYDIERMMRAAGMELAAATPVADVSLAPAPSEDSQA
jgi:membrane-anchored glycerophosphoryl diester phosphodiesterase (GDPDase)